MNTHPTSPPKPSSSADLRWIAFLCLGALAINLPRLALGPYSAVGILGDIGDFSVPYLIATDGRIFADAWNSGFPMGATPRTMGFYAPAQAILFGLLPGWLAHGLNWLFLTAVGAVSLFILARERFALPPAAAGFAAALSIAAVGNGNFGYSVVALVPPVLVAAVRFTRSPAVASAAALAGAAFLLAIWVPAKFLVLFPAIVLAAGTLLLGTGRLVLRLCAAAVAVAIIYGVRAPDLAEFITAAAQSDRQGSVLRQPLAALLGTGLDYSFEYFAPQRVFEIRPLPQTNPIAVGSLCAAAALLACRGDTGFRRLALAVTGLMALQIVFPAFWQFVLFDVAGQPGVYFHPKLMRPVEPLIFVAAGFAVAALIARAGPKIAQRRSSAAARRLSALPVALLLFVALLQSFGFGISSWFADGSFTGLYRDRVITELAQRIEREPAAPRVVTVDRPNAILAAYGIATPFGRRDWQARRYAALLAACGVVSPAAQATTGYTDLYMHRLALHAEDLPQWPTGGTALNLLALASVEYLVSRKTLDLPYLARVGNAPEGDWDTLPVSDRLGRAATANFAGRSTMSVFRFAHALPRVRAVTEFVPVADMAEAARTVSARPPDRLAGLAVVESGTALPEGAGVPDRITVSHDDRSGYAIDIEGTRPAVLAVSEIFDGGWSYEIDGTAAKPFAVNAAFVGLPVPPGRHRLRLFRSAGR